MADTPDMASCQDAKQERAGGSPFYALSYHFGMLLGVDDFATDAALTKAQANKLASLAHHGLSRAINPLTLNDGDTLFALSTGQAGLPGDLSALGAMAAEAVARAIRNAVLAATSERTPGLPAWSDLSTH